MQLDDSNFKKKRCLRVTLSTIRSGFLPSSRGERRDPSGGLLSRETSSKRQIVIKNEAGPLPP